MDCGAVAISKTALGRNQTIDEKRKVINIKSTVHVVLHDADDFSGRHDYAGKGKRSCQL